MPGCQEINDDLDSKVDPLHHKLVSAQCVDVTLEIRTDPDVSGSLSVKLCSA